ncbi:LPS-assembly protein LptD [Palleronia caenipelagi]|uniref:LPS-assembly protein LptD n=1 Tax=Palleronia caenipelagi TaxID=2489174 RepID=A0A547Q9D5_9RHOB|nr:LPS assembly protein LptD [Palleronia caenipelagi]TRD22999.1 LPS-assembly protein LptD [Palleronia caenipelagi]
MIRWLTLICALFLAPGLSQAQDSPPGGAATLVADTVRVENRSRIIAEGQVEVLYGETLLTARRITYDHETETLRIDGPITVDEGTRSAILASSAELSSDLRDGIMTSARVVLDRQLQMAASQLARVEGRYTQLDNVIASSCEICPSDPIPTWEIRANKVIHDSVDQMLYFDKAQFRVYGIPVAYIPRLRLPTPENTRQSGFLIPELKQNSELGFGIKLPYFIELGDHADLTLTPYVSNKTRTLETRYRRVTSYGALNLEGAYSDDDLDVRDRRWYVFGESAIVLPRNLRLEFDLQKTSDSDYLSEYDYSGQDRLRTEARIIQVNRDRLFRANVTDYETLRDEEQPIEDELPSKAVDVIFEQRLPLRFGDLTLGFDANALRRDSSQNIVGRDMAQMSGRARWRSRDIIGPGLVWSNQAELRASYFTISDDDTFDDDITRLSAGIATELRWPLQRTNPGGTHQLLQPVVQIAYSDTSEDDIPNEDSVIVEFDEGNLFSMSRYPGDDAVETGLRANLGLSYTTLNRDGYGVTLGFGKVFRDSDDDNRFVETSGLSGDKSDWLAAVRFQLSDGFDLTSRAILDEDFEPHKAETRVAWRNDRVDLTGSYVWLEAEPEENRFDDIHEIILDGEVRLSRHWVGRFNGRYDLEEETAADAEFGLTYRTECLEVDLGIERNFTETENSAPSTAVGLQVRLVGFGTGRTDVSYRKICSG